MKTREDTIVIVRRDGSNQVYRVLGELDRETVSAVLDILSQKGVTVVPYEWEIDEKGNLLC